MRMRTDRIPTRFRAAICLEAIPHGPSVKIGRINASNHRATAKCRKPNWFADSFFGGCVSWIYNYRQIAGNL